MNVCSATRTGRHTHYQVRPSPTPGSHLGYDVFFLQQMAEMLISEQANQPAKENHPSLLPTYAGAASDLPSGLSRRRARPCSRLSLPKWRHQSQNPSQSEPEAPNGIIQQLLSSFSLPSASLPSQQKKRLFPEYHVRQRTRSSAETIKYVKVHYAHDAI